MLVNETLPLANPCYVIEPELAVPLSSTRYSHLDGYKHYTLKDHLGNVRLKYSDIRWEGDSIDIVGVYNYYPFGQLIDNRTWEGSSARFGFQGQERDDEIAGKGNSLNTFFRQNSPQSGRWLSIDPKAAMQPSISPYVLYGNNPIMFVDPLGDIYTPPDPNRQNVEGSPVYKIKENTSRQTGDIWNSWETTGSVWSNGQAMNQSDWNNKVRTYVESLEYADFSNGMPEGDFSDGCENSSAFQATFSKYFNASHELLPWNGQPNPNMDTYNPGDDPMYDLLGWYIGAKTFQMIDKGFWVLRGAGTGATKTALNSFDDIVTNPTVLWGKTENEVANILGDGWTRGAYGSKKTGWKFIKGDKSVFYHPGNGRHTGSYYGFSRAQVGKVKIVNSDYIPSINDKALIIKIGE